jgi:hypothetical protein
MSVTVPELPNGNERLISVRSARAAIRKRGDTEREQSGQIAGNVVALIIASVCEQEQPDREQYHYKRITRSQDVVVG